MNNNKKFKNILFYFFDMGNTDLKYASGIKSLSIIKPIASFPPAGLSATNNNEPPGNFSNYMINNNINIPTTNFNSRRITEKINILKNFIKKYEQAFNTVLKKFNNDLEIKYNNVESTNNSISKPMFFVYNKDYLQKLLNEINKHDYFKQYLFVIDDNNTNANANIKVIKIFDLLGVYRSNLNDHEKLFIIILFADYINLLNTNTNNNSYRIYDINQVFINKNNHIIVKIIGNYLYEIRRFTYKNMYSNIRPHILNTIHKSSLVFKDLLKNNGMFKNNLK